MPSLNSILLSSLSGGTSQSEFTTSDAGGDDLQILPTATIPKAELAAISFLQQKKPDLLKDLDLVMTFSSAPVAPDESDPQTMNWSLFEIPVDPALSIASHCISQLKSTRAEYRSLVAEGNALKASQRRLKKEIEHRRKPSIVARYADQFARADERLARAKALESAIASAVSVAKNDLESNYSAQSIQDQSELVHAVTRISFSANPARTESTMPDDERAIHRLIPPEDVPDFSTNIENLAAAQKYLYADSQRRTAVAKGESQASLRQQLLQVRQSLSIAMDNRAAARASIEDFNRGTRLLEVELADLARRAEGVEGNHAVRLQALLVEYGSAARDLSKVSSSLAAYAAYFDQHFPLFPLSDLLASDDQDELILSSYSSKIRGFALWLSRTRALQAQGIVRYAADIEAVGWTEHSSDLYSTTKTFTVDVGCKRTLIQDMVFLSTEPIRVLVHLPASSASIESSAITEASVLPTVPVSNEPTAPRVPGSFAGQPLPRQIVATFQAREKSACSVAVLIFFTATVGAAASSPLTSS